MPFGPESPHIATALVLGGVFMQFGDPLDFIARSFGVDAKADRGELAESLAELGGRGLPTAQARGSDRSTRFRIEIIGKCEGKMVALCKMTIDPRKHSAREIEENALATALRNDRTILGIQATRGRQAESLDGLEREKGDTFMRLYPQNVFNKAFFKDQFAAIRKDKKVKLLEVDGAALVELVKPWLFYDMPASKRRELMTDNLLPFTQVK